MCIPHVLGGSARLERRAFLILKHFVVVVVVVK